MLADSPASSAVARSRSGSRPEGMPADGAGPAYGRCMQVTTFEVVGFLVALSHLAVIVLILVWFSVGKPTSWREFKRRAWAAWKSG